MLVALTIAGSDSSGGAGIEADVKAFAALGVHGSAAITCVTAQNTSSVRAIYPLSQNKVVAQIDAILEDIHVSAAKTGMLYSKSIARAVVKRLAREDFPIVVDPVLVAGAGDPLNKADLIDALIRDVVPLATILTPNIPEAEALLGEKIDTEIAIRSACKKLAEMGAEAVLLKGGHMATETAIDTFYYQGKFLQLESPRVEGRGHGGGCILSSYLAANLAKGMGMWEAALTSRAEIFEAISSRYMIGAGANIVNALGRLPNDALKCKMLMRLRDAAKKLEGRIAKDWIPPEGLGFVYALPNALTKKDVCGVEGWFAGPAPWNAPSGSADSNPNELATAAVLSAIDRDPTIRSGVGLSFSKKGAGAFSEAGFTAGETVANGKKKVVQGPEHQIEEAIKAKGIVPDIVFFGEGSGSKQMIVLGHDPEEVVSKVVKALGRGIGN
jgi:hydroxymethylpyrimidine kinase / phosphomethylpyrimidine kinase / thiamine-phosphate diphosphorylase